jgi:hypothetical protein
MVNQTLRAEKQSAQKQSAQKNKTRGTFPRATTSILFRTNSKDGDKFKTTD